jgi:hypothetical protein
MTGNNFSLFPLSLVPYTDQQEAVLAMSALMRSALARTPLLASKQHLLLSRPSSLASPVLAAARRSLATQPDPPLPHPPPPGVVVKKAKFYRTHPYWTALFASPFLIVGSLGAGLLCLWAYDASTYHHPHTERVPLDPLALEPERGGKKNLKVAKALVDDKDERMVNSSGQDKKRLVIVGGGWGVRSLFLPYLSFYTQCRQNADLLPREQSVGILKQLDPDVWHVTVVSPENYFLFHPLLRSFLLRRPPRHYRPSSSHNSLVG